MTTEEIIIHLFCQIDDQMKDVPKHSQAHLYPSEVVTVGVVFALKGGRFRQFYRWLKRDYGHLFPHLPDRTRMLRLLRGHQDWTNRFLAQPSFFTVVDTFGIELIHPIREGRSPQQVGKKGKSNHRWIVGLKICCLITDDGHLVAWQWTTANECDNIFLPLLEEFLGQTIVLGDFGFRCRDGIPANLKICRKGTWNERGIIETVYSIWEGVCHLKKIFHRAEAYIEARLGYVAALFNLLLSLAGAPSPDRMLPALAELAL
jgi:hypothetical protein